MDILSILIDTIDKMLKQLAKTVDKWLIQLARSRLMDKHLKWPKLVNGCKQ